MKEKLEHIIFDVSGTLWDDLAQVFHANYEVLIENGYNMTPDGKEKLTINWLIGNAVGSAPEMFRKFGMQGTNEELDSLYHSALENYAQQHRVELYSGVYDMLFDLISKGDDIDISIVSSHPKKRLDLDFKRLNINNFFSKVIGSSHDKTNDILELNRYFNTQNTAYIGDTSSDMIAANKAKVIPLAVSWGYHSIEKIKVGNPKVIFHNVSDLRQYLVNRI